MEYKYTAPKKSAYLTSTKVVVMKGLKSTYANSPILVLGIGLLVLFLPIVFIEANVLGYTNGVFMYPLDDTFIHWEIAKNFHAGNWGVNQNEFASASSSLLYTVLLTLARFFSTSTIMPFVLNCIAGAFAVWALHAWLKKQEVASWAQIAIIGLAVFITPLATMIISGMEHTLQCLFSFLFIFYFSGWLEKTRHSKGERLPVSIVAFAVLTASIRYEGLFLIAVACLMLLYYRKIGSGFLLGFCALLPVVVFGLYSMSKGSYFLPNSVLVKSETHTSGILGFAMNVLVEKLTNAKSGMAALATQRWLLVLPALYLLFKKYMRPSYSFILIFLMAATVLQLALAATGWLYRYEAYLFFSSTVITSVLFYKYGREIFSARLSLLTMVWALIIFFLFFPVALRSATALAKVDRACKNIFDQQYQMAQFSKKYYNNGTIAANDIGAISYFTDATIVDLWGLASIDVAKSKEGNYWTPQFLDSLCRAKQVNVAMVYDSWFSDSLTSRWKKLATWQIQSNVICGDDMVSFYSVIPSDSAAVRQNLEAYEPQLPPTVKVKYY